MSSSDIVLAAAGAAGEATYVEDVFSTWLYTGNGSTQTITNGIDLAGEGGLVWIKNRDTGSSGSESHALFDTNRGVSRYLESNSTNESRFFSGYGVTSFNVNGFAVTGSGTSSWFVNRTSERYASWTFRKAPKFFDVVTYTGNGVDGRQIAHNLGSVPGMIIVKCTSNSSDWSVRHKDANPLLLNTTDSGGGGNTLINGYTSIGLSTSTTFFVTTSTDPGSTLNNVNASGRTYVAYLFAHDAGGFGDTGTDNIISCGSFTTNSTGNATVNLGYEPQYVMIKRTNAAGQWIIVDNMRGMYVPGYAALFANLSSEESVSPSKLISPTPTGFEAFSATNSPFIYMAIRRPMKTPATATEVFYPLTIAQADTIESTGVPFAPDLVNTFSRNGTSRTALENQFLFVDRLRGFGKVSNTFSSPGDGGAGLISSSTAAEMSPDNTYVSLKADSRNLTRGAFGWNSSSYGNWITYFFRRAPGFFDIVCYTGNGANNRSIPHNLGVAPELAIVKQRNQSNQWLVWQKDLIVSSGLQQNLILNSTGPADFNPFNTDSNGDTSPPVPTTTTINVGGTFTNQSTSVNYVMYLFTTLAGISKVGSYTGTGTTQTINCGFTTGARFVLIKRTDSTGDWYVWDSARGIIAGNDPYLLLNSTAAEVTNTDYVDVAASGFEISSTAPAAINANGGTFIFLAIA